MASSAPLEPPAADTPDDETPCAECGCEPGERGEIYHGEGPFLQGWCACPCHDGPDD